MIFSHFQFHDNNAQYLVPVANTTEFTRDGDVSVIQNC